MKLLTDYLERAVQLEALAADEPDSRFKDQLLVQAQSYRKLAALLKAESEKWGDVIGRIGLQVE